MLSEVDVAHVDSEDPCLGVLFILDDLSIGVDGFLPHLVELVRVCEVEADGIGQVYVNLVEHPCLLSRFP